MSNLAYAIRLAQEYHGNQVDKCGQPFIGHPLRVMARMRDDESMMVAVLHDLVEDTEWTIDQLSCAFSRRVVEAVDAISRRKGETYKEYIRRCGQNKLAKEVKRADLLDNADPRRGWDQCPISRYRWAWGYLWPGEELPAELQGVASRP